MTSLAIRSAAQRAAVSIRTGQLAWNEIKRSAEEQRTLWLEVGVALMYGKDKANRGGLKFSEWVQEMFPGLTDAHDIADAIWFATFSVTVTEIPPSLTHPSRIRRWANEQKATQALPEDLQSVEVVHTLGLAPKDAEKAAKVIHRAASGDEGADIAKRHVEGMAKKAGLTVEEFTQAAKVGAPDTYYRFGPQLQLQLDEFRDNLRISITEMEESGIQREAIKAIFLNFANTL